MDWHTDSMSESRIYKVFENGNRGRKGEGKEGFVSLLLTLGLAWVKQSASWAIWYLLQLLSSASEGYQQYRQHPDANCVTGRSDQH